MRLFRVTLAEGIRGVDVSMSGEPIIRERLQRFVDLMQRVVPLRFHVTDAQGGTLAGAPEGCAPVAEAPVVVGLVVAGRVSAFATGTAEPGPLRGVAEAVAEYTVGLMAWSAEAGAAGLAVARLEERLRLALQATTDAIWDWDLSTNQTYYSPRWYEMLGYEPGAFPPTFASWAAMTDPEDVERTVTVVNAAVARGEGYESEFRMRHADGSWRVILGRGRVSARDAAGKPIRMSGTNSDITAVREAEQERQRLEAALLQREKLSAIGQLAGGVAHDFNNQLTTVLGCAELLMAEEQVPEKRELVADILAAAMRSADLTRKLLSFSRQGKIQRSDVDVHALVAEVVGVLRRSIDRRIRIETRLEAPSPVVKGDAADLQNALLNLALNARDAMPTGGVLTFQTENAVVGNHASSAEDLAPGRYLVLSVIDTGHGISPEVRSRLFEPFFTTKHAGQGTGMGLPSVYGTARAHQGAIRVASEVGQGSVFSLHLPAVERGTPVARRPSEIPGVPPCRVLVVDDEPLVREQLARSLRSMGHEVDLFARGADGIARLRKAPQAYEVAIVDVSMPEMSGRETLASMRQVAPGVRFIVASGFAQQGEVQTALDEGAAAFLAKPFFRAALAQALAQALASPRGS